MNLKTDKLIAALTTVKPGDIKLACIMHNLSIEDLGIFIERISG